MIITLKFRVCGQGACWEEYLITYTRMRTPITSPTHVCIHAYRHMHVCMPACRHACRPISIHTIGCLFVDMSYILATSKVVLGPVPVCDSAH